MDEATLLSGITHLAINACIHNLEAPEEGLGQGDKSL